jgi:lauroyl/myristoyl acyltransferase
MKFHANPVNEHISRWDLLNEEIEEKMLAPARWAMWVGMHGLWLKLLVMPTSHRLQAG